jgi:hypothetical protein
LSEQFTQMRLALLVYDSQLPGKPIEIDMGNGEDTLMAFNRSLASSTLSLVGDDYESDRSNEATTGVRKTRC